MSPLRRRRTALAALVGAALLPAWVSAQQAVPLRFTPGTSNASTNGLLKGPNEAARDHVVSVNAGTTLNVTLRTQSPGTYFSVLHPYGDTIYSNQGDQRTSWSGRLIDTGNYRIRVFLDGPSASSGKAANYTLSVGAEPPRSADARASSARSAASTRRGCSIDAR